MWKKKWKARTVRRHVTSVTISKFLITKYMQQYSLLQLLCKKSVTSYWKKTKKLVTGNELLPKTACHRRVTSPVPVPFDLRRHPTIPVVFKPLLSSYTAQKPNQRVHSSMVLTADKHIHISATCPRYTQQSTHQMPTTRLRNSYSVPLNVGLSQE